MRVSFHGFVSNHRLLFIAVSVASVHISSHVVFSDGNCLISWATFDSYSICGVCEIDVGFNPCSHVFGGLVAG